MQAFDGSARGGISSADRGLAAAARQRREQTSEPARQLQLLGRSTGLRLQRLGWRRCGRGRRDRIRLLLVEHNDDCRSCGIEIERAFGEDVIEDRVVNAWKQDLPKQQQCNALRLALCMHLCAVKACEGVCAGHLELLKPVECGGMHRRAVNRPRARCLACRRLQAPISSSASSRAASIRSRPRFITGKSDRLCLGSRQATDAAGCGSCNHLTD